MRSFTAVRIFANFAIGKKNTRMNVLIPILYADEGQCDVYTTLIRFVCNRKANRLNCMNVFPFSLRSRPMLMHMHKC